MAASNKQVTSHKNVTSAKYSNKYVPSTVANKYSNKYVPNIATSKYSSKQASRSLKETDPSSQ